MAMGFSEKNSIKHQAKQAIFHIFAIKEPAEFLNFIYQLLRGKTDLSSATVNCS